MAQGGLLVAFLLIEAREVEVHVRDARVEADRFAVLLDGFAGGAAIFEHDAQIESRRRMAGLELDCAPLELLGLVERFADVA